MLVFFYHALCQFLVWGFFLVLLGVLVQLVIVFFYHALCLFLGWGFFLVRWGILVRMGFLVQRDILVRMGFLVLEAWDKGEPPLLET